ncbi:protein kinase domain-containing protein [Fusibacter ferrireducens]|uniref:non-specific serine/threonine protein kinase n=1 Tax=Fusibacter ferrireducens TaxID=2785058 RepID=A0ABR9ZMV1_9FIRM|nr:protein kinase [Fusibacter ferrireducens]MBF4691641.1 protein kinase [Fusibacter ferrireducens]
MADFKTFYKEQLNEHILKENLPSGILDQYEVLACLSETENSTNYVIKHKVLEKKYLMKVCKNEHQKNEYTILSKLSYPNIPTIIDANISGEHTIIIEDYFDGVPIDQFMIKVNDEEKKSVFEALFWQIVNTLKYLHNQAQPIIHKDIKPDNVLVSDSGEIMLIDFGSSRFFKEHQSRDTVLMGTQGYASPEQYGFSPTDKRSDLYAFGTMMAEIVENLSIELDDKMSLSLEKCREIDPKNRFQSVEAMETYIKSTKDKVSNRNKIVWSALGLILVAAVTLVSIWLFNASKYYHFQSESIGQAVSVVLNKPQNEITQEDLAKVTELSIWGEYVVKKEDELKWESNPGDYVSAIIVNDNRSTRRGDINNLEDLKYMTSLKSLSLVKQNIKDISPIADLKIVHLYLSDNQIEDASVFKGMKILYTLEVGGNPISNFEGLSELSNLGELDVSDTKCRNFNWISEMTSLNWLILKHLGFEDISEIKGLYQLTHLDLENNKLRSLDALSALRQLEYLNIADNPTRDYEVLHELEQLKGIVIRGTLIEGDDIPPSVEILQD